MVCRSIFAITDRRLFTFTFFQHNSALTSWKLGFYLSRLFMNLQTHQHLYYTHSLLIFHCITELQWPLHWPKHCGHRKMETEKFVDLQRVVRNCRKCKLVNFLNSFCTSLIYVRNIPNFTVLLSYPTQLYLIPDFPETWHLQELKS